MRLWHYKLLSYLPDMQFKGQLREMVAILHDWKNKEATNHLLINHVMDFPKSDLSKYAILYYHEYRRRFHKDLDETLCEFLEFGLYFDKPSEDLVIFDGWHNEDYLRICMANLYEKHLGVGKNRITDDEWNTLLEGYKKITNEDYKV